MTIEQFADICREFGFVPKDGGCVIDLTDCSYGCPGYLVAKYSRLGGTVTMWMRRNKGTNDDPIMEYSVYEGFKGQLTTMPNIVEETDDPNELREHLCHFTVLLKNVKKKHRLKAIDEL